MKNIVFLIGRAGDSADVKLFNDGGKIARMSLATTEIWKNAAGEKQEKTQWHNVIAKGKLADLFEKYIEKGKQYAIEGTIEYRSYVKDDETRYVTEIIAKEITFL